MYSQKWNCYFQNRILMFCLPVPTLIYLWEIYIFPGSVCLFCCREIFGPILGIYKLLTDTWMWKLGLRPRNSQKRNTQMGFSLQCTHWYGSRRLPEATPWLTDVGSRGVYKRKNNSCAEPRCPATLPLIHNGYEGHHHLHSPRDPAPRLRSESGKNGLTCEDNRFIHESGSQAVQ
jgi:hypothetical protein